VELKLTNKPDWMLQSIRIGGTERNSKGNVIAKIVDKTGNLVSERAMDITVRVEVKAKSFKGMLFFEGNRLLIGDTMQLRAGDLDLEGIISNIGETDRPLDEVELPKVQKIVKLKVSNIKPWVANAITIGKKEFEADNNTTLFEVMQARQDFADKIVVTDTGSVLNQPHPVNKDVEITARMLTVVDEDKTYFKGSLMRIGSWVWVDLTDVAFSAQVTSVE